MAAFPVDTLPACPTSATMTGQASTASRRGIIALLLIWQRLGQQRIAAPAVIGLSSRGNARAHAAVRSERRTHQRRPTRGGADASQPTSQEGPHAPIPAR